MKLGEYLLSQRLSLAAFAVRSGISRAELGGLMRDGRSSASVLTRLSAATEGDVGPTDYQRGASR